MPNLFTITTPMSHKVKVNRENQKEPQDEYQYGPQEKLPVEFDNPTFRNYIKGIANP
jgi:hypothetical protein